MHTPYFTQHLPLDRPPHERLLKFLCSFFILLRFHPINQHRERSPDADVSI